MARSVLSSTAMRRIIPLTILALMLASSVAFADRGRRGRDYRDHRDHRASPALRHHDGPTRREYRSRHTYPRSRSHKVVRTQPRPYVERRAVYARSGRFHFHAGVSRTYRRPVIRDRYYDYRYRPRLVVEVTDPVPGYVWVRGHWRWDGYEWIWVPGHYAVDPRYADPVGYDDYDRAAPYDDYDQPYDGGYRY
jgi:hypothetical protein